MVEVGKPVSPGTPPPDPGVRNDRTGLLRNARIGNQSWNRVPKPFPVASRELQGSCLSGGSGKVVFKKAHLLSNVGVMAPLPARVSDDTANQE